MIKMLIRLNSAKLISEGKYSPDDITKRLDKAFLKLGLIRVINDSETLTYQGTNNPHDFGKEVL